MRFDLNIELDPVNLAFRCHSQAGPGWLAGWCWLAGDVVLMFCEMTCVCL